MPESKSRPPEPPESRGGRRVLGGIVSRERSAELGHGQARRAQPDAPARRSARAASRADERRPDRVPKRRASASAEPQRRTR